MERAPPSSEERRHAAGPYRAEPRRPHDPRRAAAEKLWPKACKVCGRADHRHPIVVRDRCECCARGEYYQIGNQPAVPARSPCGEAACLTCRDPIAWASLIDRYWAERDAENARRRTAHGHGWCHHCEKVLTAEKFYKKDFSACDEQGFRQDEAGSWHMCWGTATKPVHALGERGSCMACRDWDGL